MTAMVLPYFMCAHDPFTGKVARKETINAELSRQGFRIVSSSVRKDTYRAKVRIGDGKVTQLVAKISEQKASWQRNGDLVVEFEDSDTDRL